jgi:hypothetical protein
MLNLEEAVTQMASRIRQHGGGDWLDRVERTLDSSTDLIGDTNILISCARRELGTQNIPEPHEIWGISDPVSQHWTMAELGRAHIIAMLLFSKRVEDARPEDYLCQIYRCSDDAEKQAIIKSLFFLPDNERFKPLALDATRTNSKELLSALLVGNTYPAQHFTDSEFNGLVLKALFTRISIVDVPGLEVRSNPDLSRMCEDYIQELRDAGRDVPADIWLALAGSMSPRGAEFLIEYGSGPDPRHRYYAALAINRNLSQSEEWNEYIKNRLEKETDESVRDVLIRIAR